MAKAQVYLTDPEDVPGFNEVWLSHFKNPPATTIIATSRPGFAINDLRVEINTISVAANGKTKREVIRGPEPPMFDGWVSAIKCGDLLFLSGLMAVEGRTFDRRGERRPAPAVLRHPGQGRAALHCPAGRSDLPRGRHVARATPSASSNSTSISPICPPRSRSGTRPWAMRRCPCRPSKCRGCRFQARACRSISGCTFRAEDDLTLGI